MTYGLGTPVPSERSLANKASMLSADLPRIRSWRALDESRRLELVERALLPLNERIDSFPLAL